MRTRVEEGEDTRIKSGGAIVGRLGQLCFVNRARKTGSRRGGSCGAATKKLIEGKSQRVNRQANDRSCQEA